MSFFSDVATIAQQYQAHLLQCAQDLGMPEIPQAVPSLQLTEEQLRYLRNFYREVALRDDRPLEPYAFIRVSNEALTTRQALASIVPFFQQGVIAYHDPLPGVLVDNTLEILQEFVAEHPGFKLCHYPFPVVFHNCQVLPALLETGCSRYWLLDAFYNYAFYHLVELTQQQGTYDQAYMCKLDMDHIYNQDALCYMYYQMLQHPEANTFFCGKFNVLRDQRRLANTSGIWFHSLLHEYDHYFVKLSSVDGFKFMHVMHPEYTPGSELDFANYERIVFNQSMQPYVPDFITSYHCFQDKYNFYSQASPNVSKYFTQGMDYAWIDLDHLIEQQPGLVLDRDFWESDYLATIFTQISEQAPPDLTQYDRERADWQQLQTDEQYQPTAIVTKFNLRNAAIMEGKIQVTAEDIQTILRDSVVFQRLFSEQGLMPIVTCDNLVASYSL